MGHADPDGATGSVYRRRIADSRLVAVVTYVRQWRFHEAGNLPAPVQKYNSRSLVSTQVTGQRAVRAS